jgi:Domain of unknown function (DUF1896)
MKESYKELSHFTLRLKELLTVSFPEKATDRKFIEERSGWAMTAYEEAFKDGNSVIESTDIANAVLFKDLNFSKFDTVFQVVCNEFDRLMADEELRPFAIKMFPVCQPVFADYNLNDDFASSPAFELLYIELTGTIAIWIEDHGL